MDKLVYSNIFEAIGDNPAEAADLQFRADLMLVLRELFESRGWAQADIMAALDIPQPRVSELVTGKVSKVSSDKLIGYLAKLGYRFRPTFARSTRGKEVPVKCQVVEHNQAA